VLDGPTAAAIASGVMLRLAVNPHTAFEQKGKKLKGFKGFYLKYKARICVVCAVFARQPGAGQPLPRSLRGSCSASRSIPIPLSSETTF